MAAPKEGTNLSENEYSDTPHLRQPTCRAHKGPWLRFTLADEVQQVAQARKETEQRLRRLGQVYMDGLKTPQEYQREKRFLEDRLGSLVVPGVDAARDAGMLLENLPALWT